MREDADARRRVMPAVAGRSLWLSAAWTGAGTALVGAVTAIAVVAVCWLPAANGTGSAATAIKAGVLTFLAALHGGITVDGLPTAFVPLGMTLLVAGIAWRAGSGLADTADGLDEDDPARLVRAGLIQAGVFAAVCGIAAHVVRLGSSAVSALAATLAAFLLFAVSGGVAFVRGSALGEQLGERAAEWLAPSVRAAAAGTACYLGAGAMVVAGSLVVHHARVEALSNQVGGGWSGVPILLLGVFAAPNAAIAGASYLAGPGFALGSGTGVALGSTAHGTLPAFPILGAVPTGPAGTPALLLTALTPLVAGACAARAAARGAPSWRGQLRNAAAGAALAGLIGAALAWQGGGAIGSGRLSAVGASPWQFGLAVGGPLAIVAGAAVGARAALDFWRSRAADGAAGTTVKLTAVPGGIADDDADEADVLAG